MGLGRWFEKRRSKRLEDIRKEIDYLNKKTVSSPTPSMRETSWKSQSVPRRGNTGSLWTIIISVVIIISLSFFYYIKFNNLNENYDAKLAELQAINDELDELTSSLTEKQSELEFKTKVERDLSDQYKDLEEEMEEKDDKIEELEDDLEKKDSEINNLTDKIDEKDDIIKDIEDCVEDNSVTDKEDCI